MELKTSNGCMGSITFVDNIDVTDLDLDRQKQILQQLIAAADVSIVNIIDFIIEQSPNTVYNCDDEACEQCGNLGDTYTLTI
jgi:hypothetical protein